MLDLGFVRLSKPVYVTIDLSLVLVIKSPAPLPSEE
jgi:hypothetical protein